MALNILGYFFAGIILTNGFPHFVKGIVGERHMTPLGRDFHPVVNVVWGALNFLGGSVLLTWSWSAQPAALGEWITFGAGGILTAVSLAYYWGRPKKGTSSEKGLT